MQKVIEQEPVVQECERCEKSFLVSEIVER